MPLYTADALILRTYKLGEADRIVVFLTRDRGKKRGVAKGARRQRSRFVGALEPLTEVRVAYFESERRELVGLNYAETVRSPLAMCGARRAADGPVQGSPHTNGAAGPPEGGPCDDAADEGGGRAQGDRAGAAQDDRAGRLQAAQAGDALGYVSYFAELIDEWAQDADADDRLYRLGASMLEALAAGAPVEPLARYLEYWLLRLQGVYPESRGSLSAAAMAFLAGSRVVPPHRIADVPVESRVLRELENVHRALIATHLEKTLNPSACFATFAVTPEVLPGVTFQDLILKLSSFWASHGCLLQQPLDLEVGAGTSHPETLFRVLGPKPWSVAYVQPSRRPDDGRFGQNPNRLFKHHQYQVILKPSPDEVQQIYLDSLEACGINPRQHDIRFEEDNWESPTLGAWGIGWQVLLDGLEITQFTYFQQVGGIDLNPISCEITYGLERIAMFLQRVENVFDLEWGGGVKYAEVRLQEEIDQSKYAFGQVNMPAADFAALHRELFDKYFSFAEVLLDSKLIWPALEHALKCSHLFNILDSSGSIGVTERTAYILRVRQLAVRIARAYAGESQPDGPGTEEAAAGSKAGGA